MKKIVLPVAVFALSGMLLIWGAFRAPADTYTPYLHLDEPTHGEKNWDAPLNYDLTAIDTAIGALQSQIGNYGVGGAGTANLALYQSIINYRTYGTTPPNANVPLPTGGLQANYNLMGLPGAATSVTNGVSGGPALTLVGSPTINSSGVTFGSGSKYAVSASTFPSVSLNGGFALIVVLTETATALNDAYMSLAATADLAHGAFFYSGGSPNPNTQSYMQTRNGNYLSSGQIYNNNLTAPIAIMMASDGTNLYLTRLDTGASVSMTNSAGFPAGSPLLAIGAYAGSSVTNICTTSFNASYALLYNRIPTLDEQKRIYGYLSSKISLPNWERPQLATGVSLPDNGLQRTPMLGWSSWLVYGDSISASLIEAQAAAMATYLKPYGYLYVNIDDGWSEPYRINATGAITYNAAKFPSGISAVASYVHGLGLKLGIYSTIGPCTNTPGLFGYEALDIGNFASWGADMLKLDYDASCPPYGENSFNSGAGAWDILDTLCDSTTMNNAIPECNYYNWAVYGYYGAYLALASRPMVYEVSAGPIASTPTWATNAGGNMWRYCADANPGAGWTDATQGIVSRFTALAGKHGYASAGHFNDPDGIACSGTGVTNQMCQSEMSLYALAAAPIILSNDMTLSSFTSGSDGSLATLTNAKALAINQDAAGLAGDQVMTAACGSYTCQAWARPLSAGNAACPGSAACYAVGLFNLDTAAGHSVAVTWAQINAVFPGFSTGSHTCQATDVWGTAVTCTAASGCTDTVPATGAMLFTCQ
jgi:hypothetical protein